MQGKISFHPCLRDSLSMKGRNVWVALSVCPESWWKLATLGYWEVTEAVPGSELPSLSYLVSYFYLLGLIP